MKALIGPQQDLADIEATVWVGNMRRNAVLYWGGTVRDVITGEDVDVSTLTDAQLNERERYPLFGYVVGTGELNTRSGYGYRWASPQEVTQPESAYLGQHWMPLPEPWRPHDPDTTQRLLDAMRAVAVAYPSVREIETEISNLQTLTEEE